MFCNIFLENNFNSSVLFSFSIKLVTETQNKNELVISGKYVEAPKEKLLLKQIIECRDKGEQFCLKCTLGLDVKHTDILILSQFVRSNGLMLPRRITGLCGKQQKYISTLVTMAQKAGKRS